MFKKMVEVAVFRSSKHSKGITKLSGPLKVKLDYLISIGKAKITWFP